MNKCSKMVTVDALVLSALTLVLCLSSIDGAYQVGIGRADCTGPAADIVFMGYAKSTQKGCGIHLRQFARAYIFDDGTTRAAFVTVDSCMMPHGVKREVLKKLKNKYGDTYTDENLILSGTHTHGTPGGFLMDLLYDIPDFGFCKETFDALVDGITNAITRAHENIVDAKLYVTSGELLEANINRSPASYLLNPQEERARYKHDVDKDMVQLKILRSSDNTLIGAINWFAVHPTSMNNTNCLVTSDNVGYASILLESSVNKGSLPGTGDFVGAFASTNLGDVSPNIRGPRCINTGEVCEMISSTCNGEAKYCIASGPGKDMFHSTEIIASRMFEKAFELISDQNTVEVTGPIRYIHKYVYMPNETATYEYPNGTTQQVRGCHPAMGYSFAAGTTDGPGEFDFTQGTVSSNPFWNAIRNFIFPPTAEDIKCHSPKPILLNTGKISFPYEWQPSIVATQIVMIGNVILAAVPGEFTTMSGRRLRDAVKKTVVNNGGPENTRVIITGLSNVYTSYIATPEEYRLQRYEGASTIFGPYTLTIYQKLYEELASALLKNESVETGPIPPDFTSKLKSFILPVVFDTSGIGRHFGDCIQQPPKEVKKGDTVTARFVSGHPRNNLMHGRTFLTIEKLREDKEWEVVATDSNWETKFIWRKKSIVLGTSEATIVWQIGDNVEEGTYRIRHFGSYKYILGGNMVPYQGSSQSFEVLSS